MEKSLGDTMTLKNRRNRNANRSRIIALYFNHVVWWLRSSNSSEVFRSSGFHDRASIFLGNFELKISEWAGCGSLGLYQTRELSIRLSFSSNTYRCWGRTLLLVTRLGLSTLPTSIWVAGEASMLRCRVEVSTNSIVYCNHI
jgi:hypothetical protein